jgi:hypothetical protein
MCVFGCAIKYIVFYDYLSFLVRIGIVSADRSHYSQAEASVVLSMPTSRGICVRKEEPASGLVSTAGHCVRVTHDLRIREKSLVTNPKVLLDIPIPRTGTRIVHAAAALYAVHTVCTRNVGVSPDRFPGKSKLQIWFYELVLGLLRAGDHHPRRHSSFQKGLHRITPNEDFAESVYQTFFGVRTLDRLHWICSCVRRICPRRPRDHIDTHTATTSRPSSPPLVNPTSHPAFPHPPNSAPPRPTHLLTPQPNQPTQHTHHTTPSPPTLPLHTNTTIPVAPAAHARPKRAQFNSQGPDDKQETIKGASKCARQSHYPPGFTAPHRTALSPGMALPRYPCSLFSRYATMVQAMGVVTRAGNFGRQT